MNTKQFMETLTRTKQVKKMEENRCLISEKVKKMSKEMGKKL